MTTILPMHVLSASQHSNLEAIHSMAASMFDAAERVTALNLATVRTTFDFAARHAAPLDGETWQGLLSRRGAGLAPANENAMAYFRGMQSIAAETQAELNRVVAARIAELTDAIVTMLDNVVDQSPEGAAPAVAVARSAIVNMHAAYGNMVEAGRQVAAAKAASTEATRTAASSARAKRAA